MIERSIATGTHGRYLVVAPDSAGPAPLLVGFHGYGEGAEAQLERMRAVPGAEQWRLVSVQGLHRFYQRRANEVVASWMTRQDRELAIADNLAYAAAVMDAVDREWPGAPRLVLAGFSQGVAMTFRVAAASSRSVSEKCEHAPRLGAREAFLRRAPRRVDGVIAVGGDVPPELDAPALASVRTALTCRGARDEWYTPAIFENDVRRLREAGVDVRPLEFEGGHEWSDDVVRAASIFLRERLP